MNDYDPEEVLGPDQPTESKHPLVLTSRRSWKRRRLALNFLLILCGLGLTYVATTFHLDLLAIAATIVTLYGVVQTALVGFELLITTGTHQLEMREAHRTFGRHDQWTNTQRKEIQKQEAEALALRNHEQRERWLDVWRTSKRRLLQVVVVGAITFASLGAAFHLAFENMMSVAISFMLVSMVAFFVTLFASWRLLQSMHAAGGELAERRQLTREKAVLVQHFQGEHLTGGLSVSAGEDEGLRGGLTQDVSQGGLSQVD